MSLIFSISTKRRIKSYPNSHWHRRWIIARRIRIDGQLMFVLIARLWARHSRHNGWCFTKSNPIRITKGLGEGQADDHS